MLNTDDDPEVGAGYHVTDIPRAVQSEVDQIVESFELVPLR
jgi:hypothetical protein